MSSQKKPVPLRSLLTRLIWVCMLPLLLLAAGFTYAHVRTLQSRFDREISHQAQNAANRIDLFLQTRISALQVLAESPMAVDPGLWKDFHARAKGFQESFGSRVILADPDMRMRLNSGVPFGIPLPALPRPRGHSAAQDVLETGKPSVGDSFIGPFAKEPLFAVAVPVLVEERPRHILLTAVAARSLQKQIEGISLPAGWMLTILDGSGETLARRASPDGKNALPDWGSWKRRSARCSASRWSVVVEVPPAAYHSPILSAAAAFALAILGFTLAGVLGGRWMGRKLTHPVESLVISSLSRDTAPAVAEVEAVRTLLDDASAARATAESTLLESEHRYRGLSQEFHGLLDAIPDHLMLLDRELRIRWANRACAENFGGTADALPGRYCYTVIHNRTGPCSTCPVLQTFASGKPVNTVVRMGKNRTWDVRTVPLPGDEGRIERVITVLRDITEHEKLEAKYLQSQKMESIGTLAGGIAHDFNNILSAIIGYGHLALGDMPSGDPGRANLESLLEAADRATHLTKDLLLFSRKQAGKREPVDLYAIMRKVENFLRRVIGEDIECSVSPGGPEPLTVLADAHQIEQVLMNLATNARDAMPRGGAFSVAAEPVRLDDGFVSAHGFGKAGEYALLTVSDTGGGMDEETRKRIFEPFFTTKEVGKGTGLGLSVVYGIVEQHEGFVDVYSEPGRGTTFKIYLPVDRAALRAEAAAPRQDKPRGGSETILVAEDDETLRQLACRYLGSAGYTVILAVDGEDAVRKFREHRDSIRLLLFDMIMPKMNGREALDEIRKERPDVKAVFSSGYAPDLLERKAGLESDVELLMKPYAPDEILRKVREVLDGRKLTGTPRPPR
ncbi:MAG: ATP-binding protein [Thermodesulfobacteriota bacterium]